MGTSTQPILRVPRWAGQIEQLEHRLVMAADPRVTLLGDLAPFVGESYQLTARFDNANPTDVGYGPYIDLYLPATGADGAGAAQDDGITFVSASYLGAAVNATVLTFNASGQAIHPYAVQSSGSPLVVTGTPGDQLVVLELPFGSFTGDQPTADIQVQLNVSNLADVGTPLSIRANAGFRYGNDPLANPSTDPTITQLLQTSSLSSLNVTPALIKLRKEYIGPEDETATGPNFPRQYRIVADIADGQTITNLDLRDLLPDTMQFIAVDGVFGNPSVTASQPILQPSTTLPGGALTWRLNSVTGTTSDSDASVLFSYFIPRLDALNTAVLNPATGDDVLITNDASATGSWDPIDNRDAVQVVVSDATNADHVLTAKSIAVQKSVTIVSDTGPTGASPGDTLEYTIDFQVSDYFAFQNLLLSDTFSDGQRFDLGFTPTLSISEHGSTSAGSMGGANFSVTLNADNNPGTPATDGSTLVAFNVSNELVARSLDGVLVGGGIPTGGTGGPAPGNNPPLPFGGTTGRIRFRTVIQNDFSDTYPSGDPSVDQGDVLSNSVTVSGDLVDVTDATTPLGTSEIDTSGTSVEIVRGTLTKSIYAVNGNTSLASTVRVSPGDVVTYRIRYTLPISSFDGLTLADFLPLPVFRASEVTSFNGGIAGTIPGAGVATFGPADTFRLLSGAPTPSISIDSVANSVTFTYAPFDDATQPSTEIDILFSVTVDDDPFADGLFLTNLARAQEGTTNAAPQVADQIVQLILGEPSLDIRKGVVATSNPNASFSSAVAPAGITFSGPGSAGTRFTGGTIHSGNLGASLNANVTRVDAGDLVTFAIVIENRGGSAFGTFDVRLNDTLPTGFVIPTGGLNLRATDGSGANFTIVDLGGGLFGTGIELADPGPTSSPTGSLDPGQDNDGNTVTTGRNIAVITFDLQVADSVQAAQAIINSANLFNYSNIEGGANFTPDGKRDTAQVQITVPDPTKSIVATSEVHTPDTGTGSNANPRLATIGEIVRYRVVVPIAEGTSTNVRLRDNLPSGLTFIDDSTARIAFVSNGGLTSSTISGTGLAVVGNETTLASVIPTFPIPDSAIAGTFATGSDPVIQLGNLTNADRDDNLEFVVIEFNALVDNTVGGSNDAGENRDNTTTTLVNGTEVVTSDEQVRLRIVEPQVTINKVAAPVGGYRNTLVTYTVTLAASSGPSRSTAFDVRFNDTLPTGLTNANLVSVTPTGTVTGLSSSQSGNQFFVNVDSMDPGSTIMVVYTAEIIDTINPGDLITNNAGVTYTSLPGSDGTTSNPTGSSTPGGSGEDNGERNGSGSQNDYSATDNADVLSVNNVISGIVYIDDNNNGIVNSGETRLLGVAVRLTGTNSLNESIDRVVLTDNNGAYRFEGLLPGTYTVTQTQPTGLLSGLNTVGSNFGGSAASVGQNTISSIVIPDNVTDVEGTNYNFGEVRPSSLAGSVYIDLDTSSTRNAGDPPLPGVTITLSGLDAYGRNVNIVRTTESTGAYSFNDLYPGSYTITQTQPAGLIDAADTVGTAGGTLGPDSVTNILLGQNVAGIRYDFGEIALRNSSIAGRVYVDANNNGIRETGELAIQGVTIRLAGNNVAGEVIDLTTTTDSQGHYLFDNLYLGQYTVEEVQPTAFVDGLDTPGTVGGTAQNDRITSITLGAAQQGIDYNFGERGLDGAFVTKRLLFASNLARQSNVILASGVPIYSSVANTDILTGLALLPQSSLTPVSSRQDVSPAVPSAWTGLDLIESGLSSRAKRRP